MSLSVQLITNSSPVEKIGKTLSPGSSYNCLLKDDTSILRPVVEIKTADNISGYNYMYITDFGRYYFIDDIVSLHNNMWRVSAHVDVLETYKTQILNNDAVIERQAEVFNLYLDDNEFKLYNKEQIQTKKFTPANNSGLSKTLKYILVLNGSTAATGGGV